METEWKYLGDVNVAYGGFYYRHDINHNGFPYYTEIVRVTDLDSSAGADGLTLIEKLTVFGYEDKEKIKHALNCIGTTVANLRGRGKDNILALLCDAYLCYGYYDPQEDYFSPSTIVVVNDDYGPGNDKSRWESWYKDFGSKELTLKLHHEYDGDLDKFIRNELL